MVVGSVYGEFVCWCGGSGKISGKLEVMEFVEYLKKVFKTQDTKFNSLSVFQVSNEWAIQSAKAETQRIKIMQELEEKAEYQENQKLSANARINELFLENKKLKQEIENLENELFDLRCFYDDQDC